MHPGNIESQVFFVFLFKVAVSSELSRIEMEEGILTDMYAKSKFHSYVRPYANETSIDEPVEVRVDLHVLNLRVCARKQIFHISMYLRQEWNDRRLAFRDRGKIKCVTMHDVLGFWTPDLFFVHENSAHLHTVTKPNAFIKIYPDGKMLYSQRLSLSASCPMNLRRFPFDRQKCSLRMESYGYTADEVFLQWKTNSGSPFQESIAVSGYDASLSYTDYIIHFGKNRYSALEMEIHLRRRLAGHIYHVYLPLALFVCASWTSFWLNPKSCFVRVAISFASVFFSMLHLKANSQTLVNPDYLTAADLWVGLCCALLFAAFFGNVCVAYANENARPESPEKPFEQPSGGAEDGSGGRGKTLATLRSLVTRKNSADVAARILFPSIFIFINIAFFLYLYIDTASV